MRVRVITLYFYFFFINAFAGLLRSATYIDMFAKFIYVGIYFFP